MVIAPLGIAFQVNSLLRQMLFDMVAYLGIATHLEGKVVGLRRKTTVIVIQWRIIVVNHSPILLLPVRRKNNNRFGIGIPVVDVLKLLVHNFVLFHSENRHRTPAVGDEDRRHS